MNKNDVITAIFFYKRFGIKKLLLDCDTYYFDEWKNRLDDLKPKLCMDSESIKILNQIKKELR